MLIGQSCKRMPHVVYDMIGRDTESFYSREHISHNHEAMDRGLSCLETLTAANSKRLRLLCPAVLRLVLSRCGGCRIRDLMWMVRTTAATYRCILCVLERYSGRVEGTRVRKWRGYGVMVEAPDLYILVSIMRHALPCLLQCEQSRVMI